MAKSRFEDELREQLRDPVFAASYLAATIDDNAGTGNIGGLLHAVREIALVREGGVSSTAQQASIGRQTIYDAFKRGGNQQIRTVDAVLRTMGMRLTVQPVQENA